MIDLKLFRENPDYFVKSAKAKGVIIDANKILRLDKKVRGKMVVLERLRADKKLLSKKFSEENQKKSIEIGKEIKQIEKELVPLKSVLNNEKIKIPNPIKDDVIVGKTDAENTVEKKIGKKKQFNFPVRNHEEIGIITDTIDIERARKVSGARFYYLKNEAVFLEFALINFVMKKLSKKGFTPVITPVLVKEEAMYGTGFLPADENDIFYLEKDDLYLVGTSEVAMCSLHKNETMDLETPKRYIGFSSCFRREAGSYGKDTKGIMRTHQFDKIEMFSFCKKEDSEKEHENILEIEKSIMSDLGLPFQVLNICSGDLGVSAAKKYDLEVFIPSQEKYRELTSCSNCTDFQARRLNIKCLGKDGKKKEVAHTLNGTAVAIGRMIIAIYENYQNKNGSVSIPKVLRENMGFDKICKK